MIYEYRVYTLKPGRMEALHRRFTTATLPLFEKYNMKVIGFWEPKDQQGKVLAYMLAFDSEEHMQKAWSAFGEDPAWQAAFAESEKDGPLEEKSESTILYPSSYSPLQ